MISRVTRLLPLLFLLSASGCAVTARHNIVNSTPYCLEVTVNGLWWTTLPPGHAMGLAPHWLSPRTLVVVTAHDAAGCFQGAETWTFLSALPEAWIVDSLRKPLLRDNDRSENNR